jgi:hypothetical protein
MKRILTILLTTVMLAALGAGYAVAEEIPDITVTLDGEKIDFPDASPYLYKDRTLVPIRFISEAMGADVSWNGDEQEVTIVKGRDTIITHILSSKATLNGVMYAFDVSTRITEDRTFVPLRFVAEMLNCDVDWDENTYTVTITSPPEPVAFPEPELTVHFPEHEFEGKLFWITVDNLRDYSDCNNYEFKIDFITPSEFNTYDENMGAILGWQTYNNNEWRSIKKAEYPIYTVSSKYYTTRTNKEKFELYDGMPMEFKLSVKRLCSGEIKEYHYTETFKYPYPAKQ